MNPDKRLHSGVFFCININMGTAMLTACVGKHMSSVETVGD